MRYFPILIGIGVLIAIAISSLWLDAAGHLASGTLVLKRELVTTDNSSSSHEFLVRVVYHTGNIRPIMAELAVNEQEFDNLHIGDTVQVRYLNLHIIPGTRLAMRSTGTIIADHIRSTAGQNSLSAKHLLTTKAQVVQMRRFEGNWFRRPFLIVQLTYIPEGHRDPVQAVAETDSMSLAPNAQMTIEYDPNFPRRALILGAHS